jgi:uncharacterized membrane protein YiaA
MGRYLLSGGIGVAYVGLCMAAWPLSPGRYCAVLLAWLFALYASKKVAQPESAE